jgi:hypothetical protein
MPTPTPKGIVCPACRGNRLIVTNSRAPKAGLRVRYVRCMACGCRLKTEERAVIVTPPTCDELQGH